MSGIALVFHLDGQPAQQSDLAPMLSEMARRGPDGEDTVITGSLGLGHRHLPTTPEALEEPMPLSDPRTGCILTGDIRLDNRDDLFSTFGLSPSGRGVGDGALVLLAWERWGEACATHLLGDFAFVLWDPRRDMVFGARDQMGMRQLIYAYRSDQIFACATSARAVARHPRISAGLNEQRLAEALIDFEDASLTSTFYDGVYRLPPGHCLTVGAKGQSVWAYWEMTAPPLLRLKTDAEYAEAFREVFSIAVRARLRGAGPVGAMLSGGMDSGAVVGLACRMVDDPLPTFSSVAPNPETCVETRAIHAALALPNLDPTLISYDDLDPWKDDLIDAWQALEEPFDFHMTQPRTAYLAAKRAGVNVVLDGVAGDVLLDEGRQMARHLRSGKVLRAVRDARSLSEFFDLAPGSVREQLLTAARQAFLPNSFRGLRAKWRGQPLPPLPADAIISAEFAERVGLRQVLRDYQRDSATGSMSFAQERIHNLPKSGIFGARERYDRVAAHFGVETRDPFMDRLVWEFCLSLPMDQFQADGWPKVLLRRSMEGLLPDEIRWRRSKEHLGWTFTQRLFEYWPDWQGTIRQGQVSLGHKIAKDIGENATLGGNPLREEHARLDLLLQVSAYLNTSP